MKGSHTTWVSHKTNAFPNWVTKEFQFEEVVPSMVQGCDVQKERLELFPHQRFIRDYMQHKSPYRGVLLYHGLGVGKTCASIAVAEIMENQRDVMVLLPASLQMNYRNEIMRCGGSEFAVDQHWEFVPTRKYVTTARALGLDATTLRKFKGYWTTDASKAPNFDKLDEDQKRQVKMQLNDVISKKYEFMNYNGVTLKRFQEMASSGNVFDNKLVIIDESHLFISMVMNKSVVSTEIYRDLINAKNLKIVMLTGTPIVNHPVEIAYTFNLLGGMNVTHTIEYTSTSLDQHKLHADNSVLHYQLRLDGGKRYIDFELTPNGFIKNSNGKLAFSPTKLSDEERANAVATRLKTAGLVIKSKNNRMVHTTTQKLFPTEKSEFDSIFVDTDKHDEIFMRRMMGLVSFYESSDTSLYPTNLGVVHEKLNFSEHQLSKYSASREMEIKKERKAAKKRDEDTNSEAAYKTFSRMLCNFAFPEEIARPKPNRFNMAKEITLDDASMEVNVDAEVGEQSANDKYESRLKEALTKLQKGGDTFLKTDLAKYSPKFAKIIQNIKKTNGTSLVYSQFRTVEGLGILGLALKAQGYAEMKVTVDKNNKVSILVDEKDYMKPKFAQFSTDKDVSNALLKIFNSDLSSFDKTVQDKLRLMDVEKTNDGNLRGSLIKVMMITQSGSAGISLKNVRQVHIMEPYWNKSRVDQVIGRANRTCSHIALPPRERNFQVFMYRMKVDKTKEKSVSKEIMQWDKGLSTDEAMYDLSLRKDKLISRVLNNMRKASIDCALHKSTINKDIECFAFPLDTTAFEKAYHANISDDVKKSNVLKKVSKITVRPVKVTIDKVEYIWIQNTNELFDLKLYKRSGVLDKVGTLENMKDGWYKMAVLTNKR